MAHYIPQQFSPVELRRGQAFPSPTASYHQNYRRASTGASPLLDGGKLEKFMPLSLPVFPPLVKVRQARRTLPPLLLIAVAIFATLGLVRLTEFHPHHRDGFDDLGGHHPHLPPPSLDSLWTRAFSKSSSSSSEWKRSLAGRSIAVYDNNTYHDEVHGAVLETLKQFDGVDIRLYKWGWRWGFEQIITNFWSFEEPCLDPFPPMPTLPRGPGNFWNDLRVRKADEATDPAGRRMITDVVLTTCDADILSEKGEMLRKEWEERSPEEKFRIICVRHGSHPGETVASSFFLKRNAITHVGLGHHTRDMYRSHILEQHPEMSIHHPPAAETYIPIFQASGLRDLEFSHGAFGRGRGGVPAIESSEPYGYKPSQSRMIDSAAMQGNLAENHRNMNATLTQLFQFIQEDPGTWGYYPRSQNVHAFLPFEVWGSEPDRPNAFRLHLVGNWLPEIPEEFAHVVVKHERLVYGDYFRVLNGADVMMTAFPEDSPYTTTKASSTAGVAGTVRTPLLTDDVTAKAYGWFTPEFEARRPGNMTEIEYIRATRMGQILWDRKLRSPARLQQAQVAWQEVNGKMFSKALHRTLFKGDEDWKAKGQ